MIKKLKIGICLLAMLLLSSCSFKTDSLNNATIYTTVRPIKYIVEYLYNDYATISSIYPENSDLDSYKLTNKQIKKYSKGDIFVYNGLTSEKDIAKTLLNKNSDLLIIDVSYGLTLNNDITELWLSPNNYLMLAKNIKANLEEYIDNKSILEDIDDKYNDFEEKISLLDASFHEVGLTAKGNNKNTIVVANNTFKYLENYGFNVISLEDSDNLKEIKLNNIKNNFNNKKYKYILSIDKENSETVQNLVDNYGATVINVEPMTMSLDDDYFNIMNEYIKNLKTIIS